MKYYIEKKLNTDFDTAVSKTKEALKEEGFGILSEIDVQQKLNEKLGVDFNKYLILGACNPSFAYETLQKEDKIGTMLPCNVIVHECEGNTVEVASIDPVVSMQAIDNDSLLNTAQSVREKLNNAINSISA